MDAAELRDDLARRHWPECGWHVVLVQGPLAEADARHALELYGGLVWCLRRTLCELGLRAEQVSVGPAAGVGLALTLRAEHPRIVAVLLTGPGEAAVAQALNLIAMHEALEAAKKGNP